MAVLGVVGAARAQSVGDEEASAARITEARTAEGLPALIPKADLQVVARRHVERMIERGEPYHNPSLQSEVTGWQIVGENVGAGPDVDTVHQALMASSSHRRNILSSELTEIGIGAARTADGRVWVVQVFRRPQAAAATPAPAPTPAPRPPAPPSTAPATTAPAPPPAAPAAAPAPEVPTTVTETDAAAGRALPRVASAGRSVARAELDAERATAVVPDLATVAEDVPPAVALAAFLLAAVVALQGVTLRRLGLVA